MLYYHLRLIYYGKKLDMGTFWSIGGGFRYFRKLLWFRIVDSINNQEYMQEVLSQNSSVFQINNVAAVFPVLNEELLLLKAVLENRNCTDCLGVAVVGASVIIKGRHYYLQTVFYLLYMLE